MCLTPIRIGNPTRRFVEGLSKPMLTVPCGHCKECISKQQDDWFVRSVFETKRVQAVGGAVWFPTLTYNNEHLPMWFDDERNFCCPCFDTKHIIAFRNKMRVYLSRDLRDENGRIIWKGRDCSGENTIRYMICCEYGGERGRAHLHCLLYVPFRVPAKVMHIILQKAWIYGFVMWSKKGMIAEGLKASQYCMKYISKEMSWYKQYNIDEYLQQLHTDCYTGSRETRAAARETLKAFRRATPGHRQSMGFGIDGVNYFKNEDNTWNMEKLVDGRFEAAKIGIPPTKKGQNFMYNMPMYYVRKIFYNVDEWKLYRLSPLGEEIFALRFDLSQKRKTQKYCVYLDSPSAMATHLAPLGLTDAEVADVWSSLNKHMNGRKPADLALYDTVYRDIRITEENKCLIADIFLNDKECMRLLRDNAFDFMMAQKTIDREPDPPKIKHRCNFVRNENCFNIIPCFENFDKVLDTIDAYEERLGILQQDAYVVKRLREENLFGTENNYTSNFVFREL